MKTVDRRPWAVLIVLMFFAPIGVMGQFNTPTIDGTISSGEYGNHTSGQNMSGNVYMTWDDSNLYIGIASANRSEGAVIYLDTDPQTPINGGTNGNGSNVGFNYDGVSFAQLPFRANIVSYVKSDYREYRTSDGSGGWSNATSGFGTYADNGSNSREFSIPWSIVGGRPSSFSFFIFVTSSGGFVYNQQPSENSGGTIGTGARYPRYFSIGSTTDASSTAPFSRNSYLFNSETDISNFGSISVYDFTLNSTGRTISQGVGAVWNIAGTLRISEGAISMGSNTSPMTTNHLELGASGTLNLSTAVGGDLKASGHVTLDGTVNDNDRAIFFIGGENQFLSKSSGDATLTIPYVIVDKDDNSDRVLLSNTALRISRKATLTRGRLDPNSGSITFTSNATQSASVDPSGEGDINLTFSVERHIARGTDPNGSQLLLGSPLPAPFTGSSAGLLSNVWTQGATGANVTTGSPAVFAYNENTGMNGWTAVTDLTSPTERGKGYLIGIFKDDVHGGDMDGGWPKTLSVTGSWQSSENDGSAVTLPVAFTSDAGNNADERGWNLVSNPFISAIDWDAATGWTRTNIENWYQSLKEDGTYQGYNHETNAGFNSGSQFIAPFQAFWVKANASDPALTLTDAVKAPDNQPSLLKFAETPALWLELSDEMGRSTNTVLTFGADGRLGADRNDAPMMSALTVGAMRLGTRGVATGSNLVMQHLPLLNSSAIVPLVTDAAGRDVRLRLSAQRAISEDWSMVLVDNMTGNRYDLKNESWSGELFEDDVHRFTLIIDPLNSTSTENGKQTTENFLLEQNYPNPFNPSTVIGFQLSVVGKAKLSVYDVLGREVAVLLNETLSAGSHSVTFDASNLTSGVYMYKLDAGGEVMTRRMTLIK